MNKNYFAYVRVSTKRQGEVSLNEQRDAIAAYSAKHGLTVVKWFQEIQTAARMGRSVFGEIMRGLKKGTADGVIMHKIDRGSRNRHDWADIIDLSDEGVDIRFTTSALDLTSRGGRLMADIEAAVAADYIRNLKDEIKKGIDGCLKLGLYPLPAPLGYLDQGKGRAKEVDATKAPLVRLAFELYATGSYPLHMLLAELHKRGLRSRRGTALRLDSLSDLLRNPFYIGLIKIKRRNETYQGAHTPLISKRLFEDVQGLLNRRTPSQVSATDHLYRRLFKCAACGYSMVAEIRKGHSYYRCHGKACKKVSVREEVLLNAVHQAMAHITISERDAEDIFARAKEIIAKDCDGLEERLNGIDLQEQAIAARLDRLTDALLDQSIDKDAFESKKASLLMQRCELVRTRGTIAADKDLIPRKVERFLGLARSPSRLAKSASQAEIRGILLALSSDRMVRGKEVVITLAEPFSLFFKPSNSLNGGPYPSEVRTQRFAEQIYEWAKTDTTDYEWLHTPLPGETEGPNGKTYAFQGSRAA